MSITLNVPQYSVTEDTVYWNDLFEEHKNCLLYTSPSPRDA